MFEWSDLRVFLAVARRGSTLAASRALRCSQSTAARRVAALEAALGHALFERRQDGYRPTPAALALLPAAEAMEAAAARLAVQAEALARGADWVLRLTTLDLAMPYLLAPFLPGFQAAHPHIRVEIDTTDRRLDIALGEADLGIRFGARPEGAGLVVRRLGTTRMVLCASPAYLAARGAPAGVEAIGPGHALILGAGGIGTRPAQGWITSRAPQAQIATLASTDGAMLEALRAGLGLCWVPDFVAAREPAFIPVLPPPPELDAGVWLVLAEARRQAPPLRAFVDYMAPRLAGALTAPATEFPPPAPPAR